MKSGSDRGVGITSPGCHAEVGGRVESVGHLDAVGPAHLADAGKLLLQHVQLEAPDEVERLQVVLAGPVVGAGQRDGDLGVACVARRGGRRRGVTVKRILLVDGRDTTPWTLGSYRVARCQGVVLYEGN